MGAAKVRLLNCNLAGSGLSVLYLLTGGFFCPSRSGWRALSGRYCDIAPGTRMQFMGCGGGWGGMAAWWSGPVPGGAGSGGGGNSFTAAAACSGAGWPGARSAAPVQCITAGQTELQKLSEQAGEAQRPGGSAAGCRLLQRLSAPVWRQCPGQSLWPGPRGAAALQAAVWPRSGPAVCPGAALQPAVCRPSSLLLGPG